MAIPGIKTRVPLSKEQKLAIPKGGERVSVKPICAKYKISDGRYRYWRKTISGIQPRKQLSSQQKLRILEEGYQNGTKETCGAHGVDPTSYFRWEKKFRFLKSRPIPGKPRRFVNGYLQKKDYQEGSYVKEGDLMFERLPVTAC